MNIKKYSSEKNKKDVYELSSKSSIKQIDKLSDAAKRRYSSLSEFHKKRILRKAEKLAKNIESKKYAKSSDLKKRAKRQRGRQRTRGSLHNRTQTDNLIENISGLKDNYLLALSFLLENSKSADEIDAETDEDNFSEFQRYLSGIDGGKGFIRNQHSLPKAAKHERMMGSGSNMARNDMAKALLKRDVRTKAAKASQSAHAPKLSAKNPGEAIKSIAEKSKESAKQLIKAMQSVANPIFLIAGLVIVVISAVIVSIAAVLGSASGVAEDGESSSYEAKVSEKTESYRHLVEKYCEKYEIADYVELVLAMIEQESGGNPPDVMQTEKSYYNTNPPIDTAEESIDCGTHELSDCLNAAKCKWCYVKKKYKLK